MVTIGSWFAAAVVVVPLKDGCLHPLRQQLMLMVCCSIDDAVANAVLAGFLVCWGFLLHWLVGGCWGWLGPRLYMPMPQLLRVVWLLWQPASLCIPLAFFLQFGFGEDSGA
ncbi:hypothetical protein Ancab_019248 [Ancistrocladus abbreviatus]